MPCPREHNSIVSQSAAPPKGCRGAEDDFDLSDHRESARVVARAKPCRGVIEPD
jgi:hypothetical protein